MKAVLQRVVKASVAVQNEIVAEIGNGLLLFIGIEDADTKEDIDWLCAKIVNLRIFNDANDVMNVSVKESKGELLVVSQFTLHAATKKGNRPSYSKASTAANAIPVYQQFLGQLSNEFGEKVKAGKFGADMKVELINDGPVTIIIDTKNKE